jgi:hypothetical protein
MHVIERDSENIHLRLSYEELARLKIAMDEAMLHMDDTDLHARVGLARAEADSLRHALSSRTPEDDPAAPTWNVDLTLDYYELIGLSNAVVYGRYHMNDADQQRTGLHRAQAESLIQDLLPLVDAMPASVRDNEAARGLGPGTVYRGSREEFERLR